MGQQRIYPVGIQDFEKLRTKGAIYIDKTELIYKLVQKDYVFLSRPRRFGKSLLSSTLKYYFQGRKDLFQGLAIEKLEKEWLEYPVLHFDLSTAKNRDLEGVDAAALLFTFSPYVFSPLVIADLKPVSWVPPSMVAIVLQ